MTDHNKPYQPVACAIHSEFELAIMRRQQLQISWRDHVGVEHSGLLRPTDLITEQHAEYLIGHDPDGVPLKIRLDSIQQYRMLS